MYSKIKSIIQEHGIKEVRNLYSSLLSITTHRDEIEGCLTEMKAYKQLMNAYGERMERGHAAQLLYAIVIDLDDDYEVGNWRIIHRNNVDDILASEIAQYPEFIGSMNKYYLADALDIPYQLVQLAQSTCEYYTIGGYLSSEQIANVAEQLQKNEGYAAWFGPETEIDTFGRFSHYLFNKID